jgi:hypothetical protein
VLWLLSSEIPWFALTTPARALAGVSAIDWQPIKNALTRRLTVCPTCDGRKVQRCLNCCGSGVCATAV